MLKGNNVETEGPNELKKGEKQRHHKKEKKNIQI